MIGNILLLSVLCLFVGILLSMFGFVDWFGYPLHASCKIQWSLPSVSCDVFAAKIITQLNLWDGPENCVNGGEKCLYKITSQTSTEIKGTHTTPVKHYVDDISFTMTTSGTGCDVQGFSTSETWYAYLDYGTNYCNLHNLITGVKEKASNSTSGQRVLKRLHLLRQTKRKQDEVLDVMHKFINSQRQRYEETKRRSEMHAQKMELFQDLFSALKDNNNP